MKQSSLLLLSLLISYSPLSQAYDLSDFIIGKYTLIGKKLNSSETYQGTIEITKVNNKLIIQKVIDKNIINGTASIENVLAGESKVLRIQINHDNEAVEETCLIDSDLDNYARISCYLYQPKVQTSNPGLEAFFINNSKTSSGK